MRYKLHSFMNKKLNIGDKVKFDSEKIELFKAETSGEKAVQHYQQCTESKCVGLYDHRRK